MASIDELTTKISTSETELSSATEIRSKENKVFLEAEKELVETVDSLERAIMVLKKNLGFMQTGRTANILKAMAGGLKKVVEASWVNEHQKAVLQSLLQTNSEDSDKDLEFQPQGKVVAFESSSGGILDTIADMQSKAEDSLSSTRKDEMEAAHAYALVKQGLEDEIKVAKKQLSEATLTRSTTEEELHSADASLSETEETLAADTKYLEELKQSCTMKAKEILSEGVKVFLQTSSRTRLQSETDASLDARSQVVRILKTMAKKENSYALAQLAQQARSDPS